MSCLSIAWNGTLPAQINAKIFLCLSLLNIPCPSPRLFSIPPARGLAANSGKPQQTIRLAALVPSRLPADAAPAMPALVELKRTLSHAKARWGEGRESGTLTSKGAAPCA